MNSKVYESVMQEVCQTRQIRVTQPLAMRVIEQGKKGKASPVWFKKQSNDPLPMGFYFWITLVHVFEQWLSRYLYQLKNISESLMLKRRQ